MSLMIILSLDIVSSPTTIPESDQSFVFHSSIVPEIFQDVPSLPALLTVTSTKTQQQHLFVHL